MSRQANIARVGAMVAAAVLLLLLIGPVNAAISSGPHTLTVDGVLYAPAKVVGSGETVHYFTPGGTPSTAVSERHTWTGNGSENLPCDGRLHWIDNKNNLVISHCEGTSTTTTTTPTTTTTVPPTSTTTTSPPPTTTTTSPPTSTTTTTLSTATTTTTLVSVTTTVPEMPCLAWQGWHPVLYPCSTTTTTVPPCPCIMTPPPHWPPAEAASTLALAPVVAEADALTLVERGRVAAGWILSGVLILIGAAAYGLHRRGDL